MSSGFIGSKIAIVTKSQNRYSGTIIGIDAQASSIVLGNVKCFGTDNRGSTSVPIMQFANSDIEDLKIVDEEQAAAPTTQTQTSIHDDPAIVSAVMSSSNSKDSPSVASRLMQGLHQLNLSDEPKKGASHSYRDNSEAGAPWSLLSQVRSMPAASAANNKSKFFDDFAMNNATGPSLSSNTHATQTYHRQQQYKEDRGLPVRQPFFSDDQFDSRPSNGYRQRSFPNHQRRGPQRRPMGGNRETFYDNGNLFENDFDFESSNRQFNKISHEDEFKQQIESPVQYQGSNADHQSLYDKKKSFFDNITGQETTDLPMHHRSRNQDTFGMSNDRYQRSKQQRPHFHYRY